MWSAGLNQPRQWVQHGGYRIQLGFQGLTLASAANDADLSVRCVEGLVVYACNRSAMVANTTMSKTMKTFWMDSKIPDDSRWHSKHEGDFRTKDRLADHFVGKLRDVCRNEKSEVAIMIRFTRILKELLDSYESQANLLLKLADTGRVAALLHRYISNALDTLDILNPVQREEWHAQLRVEREERLQVFKDFIRDEEQLVAALGDKNQQLEIVTLLRYCVEKYHDGITPFAGQDEKYRDKLLPAELDTISMVYDVVVEKAGIVSDELPDWFVTSEHEWAWVNKAKLEDSKQGWEDLAREKDADENVSAEVRGEVCEEVCVRLASIWTELNHPHLRKFYGASYVGKPFVIHETCFPPTFEKDVWHYLANCALGFQYVHDHGLVYHAVSPATLLCSYSERRGVLDGLGLVSRSRVDRSHVIGSTAGENQDEDQESAESYDVLRFGMSVFFVLLGARNSNLPGATRDKTFDSWKHKTHTHLPDVQPGFIKDDEWEMLQGLCAENRAGRTKLEDVGFKMELLAGGSPQQNTDQPGENISSYIIPSFGGTASELLRKLAEEHEDEFSPMDESVFNRLRDVYTQLENAGELPGILVEDFSLLLGDFFMKFDEPLLTSSMSIHIASQSVAGKNYHFHHQIDHLVHTFPQLHGMDTVHRWQPTWDKAQTNERDNFLQLLKNPSTFLQYTKRPEDIAMLRFEAQTRAGAYAPEIVEAMSMVLNEAEQRGVKGADVIPKWFIPSYQVKLEERIGDGGFAIVNLGKWFGTDVVVKRLKPMAVDESARKQFHHEADLWFTLNHSNLIKLYGACYEGQQPFFVCERATRQTLTDYLKPKNGRRRELWFRLLQAALGIEHLHDHNIVHGDLKNDNILVCEGGAAKIADFGLSVLGTTPKSKKMLTTEAVRWKAPECLEGNLPTFASDIYAFGMCIIEAVTGEFPWGRNLPDKAVFHAVKIEKEMPGRPAIFKDKEWDLVRRMCRWDPEKRIGIGSVIKILEDIGISNLIETGGNIGPTRMASKMRS
ncbi:Leucine-rich repeat serine/threonine-protein kinase 2 [Phytophthora pseudosyringae]|uniref:Leucine-rich repeat serine/threonine-protein kinase 2 n=1 Tax=Phytophthora pseudosyringae TaxID=221518 RepID=A0A8T1VL83_9STRA|nr:Leucine-rich repeat serine/threonine-protein kinase 2 [Phytophthora pseudosyringae]